jgi:putative oxidoreductase
MNSDLHFAIAIATARIFAGILFFFQGYDKVFKVGMPELRQTMNASLENYKLPRSFIGFVAVFSSYTELICGFLLIIGFFKFFAIYLLCINLLMMATGFSMAKPMWETTHVFVRFALLMLLLLTPAEWDRIAFDYLFTLSKLQA